MNWDRNTVYAYAVGYYWGREHGTDGKIADFSRCAAERVAFNEGYERGVSDYCDMDVGDEKGDASE